MAGWNCNSNVISIKTSKSVEDCFKQFADHQAKYPKDFTTQPKIIFTWQGKGNRIATYSEDFGGLNGKFTSGNTATKAIIMAQLTNKTKDQLAYVVLKTDSGVETGEYIYPGDSFTKKYDTKNLDIKVIYLDNKVEPTEEAIHTIKEFVHKSIINENGKLKTIPPTSSSGIRR